MKFGDIRISKLKFSNFFNLLTKYETSLWVFNKIFHKWYIFLEYRNLQKGGMFILWVNECTKQTVLN